MSFDPHYCQLNGKRRYRTHTIALLALVEVTFDLAGLGEGREKKPVRTYQCPTCKAWHLTSKPWEESHEYQLTLLPQRVESTQVSRTPRLRNRKHAHGKNR